MPASVRSTSDATATSPQPIPELLPEFFDQDFTGRVTTARAVTLIPVSSLSLHAPLDVSSLAAGPDGSLWFTQELAEKHFGRISPRGVVKKFAIADLIAPPQRCIALSPSELAPVR